MDKDQNCAADRHVGARGCDLIVMASHGHRGFRKLLLGSQTSEVLADGSVPVLVVQYGPSLY
jgi:nucleotide-binding universal stress UspA family protein